MRLATEPSHTPPGVARCSCCEPEPDDVRGVRWRLWLADDDDGLFSRGDDAADAAAREKGRGDAVVWCSWWSDAKAIAVSASR
jgi:hypothetical protein